MTFKKLLLAVAALIGATAFAQAPLGTVFQVPQVPFTRQSDQRTCDFSPYQHIQCVLLNWIG